MMYELHCGDCLEVMRGMADWSVDLTVTSPPYDGLREYDGTYVPGSLNWRAVIKELYRITAIGGVVVWVVADATRNGTESGTSFRQALHAYDCNFNLHDTMIYEIAGTGAKGSNYAYWQSFEYMFVWSKGVPKTVNRIADVKNSAGGALRTYSAKQEHIGSRKFRPGIVNPMYSVRPNIWRYTNNGHDGAGDHPAPFPLQLAKDHIVSWSAPDDMVFDPFLGSGTTGIAAIQLGRNFKGIEIYPAYYAIAQRRIENAAAQPMLFAANAL
jgi:DNA modification methylase